MKKYILLLFLIILLPYFKLILPGFPSLQDQMHPLRLTDLRQCLSDHQIPCRYSTKSALGYGYPLFNFYGQGAYLLPALFSYILPLNSYDLMKIQIILFAFIGGLGIFLLAKTNKLDNPTSILFATIFSYIPYFALDVYVRGAIPEFSALMLIPWIFFLSYQNRTIFTNLALSLIILTHIQTGLITLLIYLFYLIFSHKNRQALLSLLTTLLLCSFYLIPVILENNLVQLSSTTKGIFDYNIHFLNLKQIFISPFWGYGASTWLDKDGMGFTLGIPLIFLIATSVYLYFKYQQKKLPSTFLLIISILFIFLAHTRSAFIWKILPLGYYQFPWRFLGLASIFTIIFSINIVSKSNLQAKFLPLFGIILITILINAPYFRPDIVLSYDYLNTPQKQIEISLGGIQDYWPTTAKSIPTTPAPNLLLNLGPKYYPTTTSFTRKSNSIEIKAINPVRQELIIPMSYYPGWELFVNSNPTHITLDSTSGFPKITLDPGQYQINMYLQKTKVQKYSEYLSLLTIFALIFIKIKNVKQA